MNYFYCETCKKYWKATIQKIEFGTKIRIELNDEIAESIFQKAKNPTLHKGICGYCRHEDEMQQLKQTNPDLYKQLRGDAI